MIHAKPDPVFDAACASIEACPLPAFIKDSELRYLAVNRAYAELLHREPNDLVGRVSEDFADADLLSDRDEKERRCLVFGKNQIAVLSDAREGRRYRIRLHRERREDGRTFIVGAFEAFAGIKPAARAPAVAPVAKPRPAMPSLAAPTTPGAASAAPEVVARPGLSEDVLLSAIDQIDAGLIIYDADDRLVFANRPMKEMFAGLMPPLEPGLSLRTVLETLYDRGAVAGATPIGQRGTDHAARAAWVADRIARHRKPYHDQIEEIAGGRWIKSVSRRLDNGLLIGVRMDITELKAREASLETHLEEVELFKSVLDALPISTYVKDDQFRLTFVNREYLTLTGRKPEEIIGKTDVELFGEEGKAFLAEDVRVRDTGAISEVEEILTRADGAELALVARKSMIRSPAGRTYLIGSSLDITAHKRREAELFESRRAAELMRSDLESVIDGLNMGVVVVDENDCIEIINNAFFEIWKQLPRDAIGEHFRTLIDINRHNGIYDVRDADWEAYVRDRLAEIRAGHVAPRELVRADGRTLIYSVRPLSLGRRMICYFDISELKRREREAAEAQRALQEASRLMRVASSAMAQGLLIYDAESILFTNDAFHAMVGFAPDLVGPGTPWKRLIELRAARGDYGDEATTSEAVTRIFDEGVNQAAHGIESRTPDGRWLRTDAKPSGDGLMVVTYTDVTEAKDREKELHSLVLKAEMADRAKSEFLANMSHEIRTPMNGVLGMAELLARTQLDTRQKTFTDVIVKSGNALLTIINDILDFSKIDAGQIKMESAPFNLAETIEDVATLVSSQVADKDIEFIVRIAPDVPERLVGDVGRVRQVITNLIGNAGKFTEIGHILIDVGVEAIVEGRARLSIVIEDTGIGIPQDKLETIFEKFSQVDGSSTRRHEGTGLGLAITAALVEMMHGTIRVTSEEGKGSTFRLTVELPVDTSARPEKSVPVDVTGARILVIDDNPVNRAILEEQMRNWGFDGCAVASGIEGLAVLESAAGLGVPVDAVILDYHMPQMNGAEVALAIRRAPGIAATPIVMLTSVDVKTAEPGMQALAIEAHLMKPARGALLLETIVSVLQRARQSSSRPGLQAIARNLAAGGEVAGRSAGAAEPAHSADATGATATTRANDVAGGSEPDTPGEATVLAAPVSHVLKAGRPVSATTLDVLVAEDNEVNQIVFSQILEDLGLSFRVVDNGEQAVAAHASHRPRIILMDVSMPVMNGHQASRAIRVAERETGEHVPIIGVTAHALRGDRERCIEAGMDDYLSKPISPEKLMEKIRRWLGEDAIAESA